ncbi:GNAT family N-acetyltransferase [Neobacillus sp. PS3-40]|uniref:GNAT family N-acetyltransferase n=1 Tax=Neobacillus sp. PS3-40 TaxID=3070679 RepID=UPI0027DFB237|nr:GNAT family N-acetyltransferase [Neobacillus sp. PS3-40]WML44454.1 GNAT family N-acetyltransferase [Neobacillus sp. PS3-40]
MTIRWAEITVEHSIFLEKVFELYDKTFPFEVREPHDVFLKSLHYAKTQFPNHFRFLVGTEGDELASFATAHYLADINTGYIVYIATKPSLRGKGLGSKTLAKIEQLLSKDAIKAGNASLRAIVLETEKQELAATERERKECKKRTLFFERNGFHQSREVSYLQPPLHEGENPVPLNLFINKKIVLDEIKLIIQSIYKEKYNLVNGIGKNVLANCLTAMGIHLK